MDHLLGGGQSHVATGKKLLEQYPWQEFTPHPEWVAFENLAADETDRPFAAGIADKVRVIWVPRAEKVVVKELNVLREKDNGITWTPSYFDPVTGEKHEAYGEVSSNGDHLMFNPPEESEEDWVFVLEAVK